MSNEWNNIVKVREDHNPLYFSYGENDLFICDQPIEWGKQDRFSKPDLRARIEPWLTSLCQSEHLSLLLGSGLSTAIQSIASTRKCNAMSSEHEFPVFSGEIKESAKETAKKSGRNEDNIEDLIRSLNELISGLEIIKSTKRYKSIGEDLEKLREDRETILKTFADDISQIEKSILQGASEDREKAFNTLTMFLMSFASRTGTRDRLNIFTTNYDRVIEAGADVAGLRLIDRFVGALSPVFRSSRLDIDMHYNPPGMRGEPRYLEGVARFTKLHGSLDWVNFENEIRRLGIPFGCTSIAPLLEGLNESDKFSRLMIYPNASKDKETTEYPYVELFRDFASALCRPNSVLVTYGYSFGDDHINRIIHDMLTIPSTHLVVISYDDASGRIMKKFESWGRKSQMSLIVGSDIANLQELVNYYLPKPSIDRSSIRMADLLRQRFTLSTSEEHNGENVNDNADSKF